MKDLEVILNSAFKVQAQNRCTLSEPAPLTSEPLSVFIRAVLEGGLGTKGQRDGIYRILDQIVEQTGKAINKQSKAEIAAVNRINARGMVRHGMGSIVLPELPIKLDFIQRALEAHRKIGHRGYTPFTTAYTTMIDKQTEFNKSL